MEHLDTPASRFDNLPDYPFEPHFHRVGPSGLRMHYVDEGPRDGRVLLMLHGEPSWSYLYRFMIPICVAEGYRVIAPDLIGFGKSSKPTRIEDHSYRRQCDWVRTLIEGLALQQITLFGQDWGSLIGLRLAAELEPRFAAVVIGNGYLPTGDLPGSGLTAVLKGGAFLAWRTFARLTPVFPTGRLISFASGRMLTSEERRAYEAPFPDPRYEAGVRALPRLVPTRPDDPAAEDNRAAWRVLERWHKPFVTAFSTGDPIFGGLDRLLQRRIPGAQGQAHQRVPGGHFLQEVSGPALAQILCDTAREAQLSVSHLTPRA